MTSEQLKELAEALSILSARSSVIKERQELRALMEENLQAEEVSRRIPSFSFSVTDPDGRSSTGPQVSLWGPHEKDPDDAHEDRQPAVRL